MHITKERFITINKYAVIAGAIVYLVSTIFTKSLQPGILFVLTSGFFCLLHQQFFLSKLKLAAHVWLVPLFMSGLTYSLLLEKTPSGANSLYFSISFIIGFVPFVLLMTGWNDEKPPKKPRLKIISARIIVQNFLFLFYVTVTAFAFIQGSRVQLLFWGMFHVFTVAIFPFLIGRVLCGWLCPNATVQDALLKNLHYKRPIPKLPRAIEEQSKSCAVNISGNVDKTAPYMPATLLLAWFPMFFIETVFDLTGDLWYPIYFMYGLFFLSILMPWRKLCTHFCWLSSYRGLAGQNSWWRLRFNRSKCRNCKKCLAEAACPFFIDITKQDNEMPATCCLCFSCMEACPFDDVITFRRAKAEKERLKAEGA